MQNGVEEYLDYFYLRNVTHIVCKPLSPSFFSDAVQRRSVIGKEYNTLYIYRDKFVNVNCSLGMDWTTKVSKHNSFYYRVPISLI